MQCRRLCAAPIAVGRSTIPHSAYLSSHRSTHPSRPCHPTRSHSHPIPSWDDNNKKIYFENICTSIEELFMNVQIMITMFFLCLFALLYRVGLNVGLLFIALIRFRLGRRRRIALDFHTFLIVRMVLEEAKVCEFVDAFLRHQRRLALLEESIVPVLATDPRPQLRILGMVRWNLHVTWRKHPNIESQQLQQHNKHIILSIRTLQWPCLTRNFFKSDMWPLHAASWAFHAKSSSSKRAILSGVMLLCLPSWRSLYSFRYQVWRSQQRKDNWSQSWTVITQGSKTDITYLSCDPVPQLRVKSVPTWYNTVSVFLPVFLKLLQHGQPRLMLLLVSRFNGFGSRTFLRIPAEVDFWSLFGKKESVRQRMLMESTFKAQLYCNKECTF